MIVPLRYGKLHAAGLNGSEIGRRASRWLQQADLYRISGSNCDTAEGVLALVFGMGWDFDI